MVLLALEDGQGDEGDWLTGQDSAVDRPGQIARLVVDVLHHGHLTALEDPPGHPLSDLIAPARTLLAGQPVGVTDGQGIRARIHEQDPAPVETQELGDQPQDALDGIGRIIPPADDAGRLLDDQQLRLEGDGGLAG